MQRPREYDVDVLLERIGKRYDTRTETVTVGNRTLSIQSVRDTNALLDAIDPATFMEDERLPYWAELWPSAIALARWVSRYPGLEGKRVLELGCGLGLSGIAAAAAGARVTMTDYDEDALLFARFNAALNLPDDFVDFYELMQISPGAEVETIHRVYRMLAQRFHPDNPETGDTEKFLALTPAHETLTALR